MTQFRCISIETAHEMISSDGVVVVDVRDEQSFAAARIPGATSLGNDNLQEFIDSTDPSLPVIVYCYHGISSQSAAAFLSEKGFKQLYSMDGGFEQWRGVYPIESE